MMFNAAFNNISVTKYIMTVFFIGGGNRSAQRKSQTFLMSLTNFIT